jgi:4'-phosphopantetheinyl transferase
VTLAETRPHEWRRARATPPLEEGDVHVWRASLDLPRESLAAWLTALSSEERARAARLVVPEKGRRRAAARALLRGLLGGYLDAAPADIALEAGRHGKPRLAGPSLSGLHFNVSHSADTALFAFARAAELGVDLERVNARTDITAIARRFFAPGERTSLEALPESERRLGFFRCWTRKEAYLKLRGSGISQPLDGFEVSVGRAAALLSVKGDPAAARRVRLLDLDMTPGFAACLAVESATPRLRLFAFQP